MLKLIMDYYFIGLVLHFFRDAVFDRAGFIQRIESIKIYLSGKSTLAQGVLLVLPWFVAGFFWPVSVYSMIKQKLSK